MIGDGGDDDEDIGSVVTPTLYNGDGCCGDIGEDGKMTGSDVESVCLGMISSSSRNNGKLNELNTVVAS